MSIAFGTTARKLSCALFNSLIAIICTVALSAAWAGESKTFKVIETDRVVLSEHTLTPPDVAGHALTLQVVRQVIKAPTNAEYDGADVMLYLYSETVKGTGSFHGVTVDTLKNGDQVFWNFRGNRKRVEKSDGAWEVTFEGDGEIVGGTGKYKNSKGYETFSGRVTADSGVVDTEITWEY
jgi:hypothetical protein